MESYTANKKVCLPSCSLYFVFKKVVQRNALYNSICILKYNIKCLNKTKNVWNDKKKCEHWSFLGHSLGRWIEIYYFIPSNIVLFDFFHASIY